MYLLDSPSVQKKLRTIRSKYQLNPEVPPNTNDIDRFFWLRASKRAEDESPKFVFRSMVHDMEQKGTKEFRVCNLVLKGGGTLGLAHAGFVAGLEAADVRFLGLAGTSAGALIAIGLAAIRGDDLSNPTHEELAELSSTAPMDGFIDGPRPVRLFIKRMLKQKGLFALSTWFAGFFALRRLKNRRGLNYGDVFETWLEDVMKKYNFSTIEQLQAALDTIWADIADLSENKSVFDDHLPPPIPANVFNAGIKGKNLLKLVATAMPVGLKFTFPEDLRFLSAEYQQVSPSRLVRTSMSIPAFFEPVIMRTGKKHWPEHVNGTLKGLLPENRVTFFKELEELVFLDGGLVSNLPSDSFRHVMQNVPTVVVPLSGEQENPEITSRRAYSDLLSDALACISAVRLQRDREVWQQNIELAEAFEKDEQDRVARHGGGLKRLYSTRIAAVNTADKNWLNFVMSDQDKTELFQTGLDAAEEFLKNLGNTTTKGAPQDGTY